MRLKRLLPLCVLRVASGQTLEDILEAESDTLSLVSSWLTSEQVVLSILSNAEGVTLLAPSNSALTQLYSTPLANQLAQDPNLLTAFLSYHVLSGIYFMSDLNAQPSVAVPTFLNIAAYSNVTGGQKIESRSNNGTVSFFSGGGAQSNVVTFDYNYVGGTVHVIDSVLTIPASLTDTLVSLGLTAAAGALRQAGMENSLSRASDVTVFAPTNDAFNAIGNLVNGMSVEQLTRLLNYHIIPGKVLYSETILGGTELTAEGANVSFRYTNDSLFVNSARVVQSNLLISNGVVHIVDGVLNPANASATPDPSAATQAPAFDGASSATGGVPFTSAAVTPTSTATTPTIRFSAAPVVVGHAAALRTAAVGAAVLLGGAAALVNF